MADDFLEVVRVNSSEMPPLADGVARKKQDQAFGNVLLGKGMRMQAVNIFINDHQGAAC